MIRKKIKFAPKLALLSSLSAVAFNYPNYSQAIDQNHSSNSYLTDKNYLINLSKQNSEKNLEMYFNLPREESVNKFTFNNIKGLLNHTTELLNKENHKELNNAFVLLKAAFHSVNKFNNEQPYNLKISENDIQELKQKAYRVVHSFALNISKGLKYNKDTIENGFGLIAAAGCFKESSTIVEYVLKNSIGKKNTENPFSPALSEIQNAINQAHYKGDLFNTEQDRKLQYEIYNHLKNIITNDKNIIDKDTYEGYIISIGNYLLNSSYKEDTFSVLKFVIKNSQIDTTNYKNTEKDLQFAVQMLRKNDVLNLENCKDVTDKNNVNVCELKTNVIKDTFKNRFRYDNKDIIIYSSLPQQEVDKLYLALKQVYTAYLNNMPISQKIENQPRLQIFLYDDYKTYMRNKVLASNLGLQEDGGIYISKNKSFYTYAGYGVENRFRHEFIHYLNDLYIHNQIVKNTFGTAPKNFIWIEEGLAEYFTGASINGEIIDRKDKILSIDPKNIQNISQIMNSTYATKNVLYNQGYALINFLHKRKNPIFQDLMKSFIEKNYSKSKEIYNNLNSLNNEFKDYMNGLIKSEKLKEVTPIEFNRQEIRIDNKNYQDITTEINTIIPNSSTTCETISASTITDKNQKQKYFNSIARFSCTGVLTNIPYQLRIIKLNLIENEFKKSNMQCFISNRIKNEFTCEGSLKIADFSRDISTHLQEKIISKNQDEKRKTFKDDSIIFYIGDNAPGSVVKDSRELDALNYSVSIDKISNTITLILNQNGEFLYKNNNKDDYSKKTVIFNIENEDDTLADLANDDLIKFTLNFLKMKEIDPRFFQHEFELDERNYSTNYLYKDPTKLDKNKEFVFFDHEFEQKYVNGFKFEVDQSTVPEGASVTFSNEESYIFSYVNPNKIKGKDDIVKFKASKNGLSLTYDVTFTDKKELILQDTLNIPNFYNEFIVQKSSDFYLTHFGQFSPQIKNNTTDNFKFTLESPANQCGNLNMGPQGNYSYNVYIEDDCIKNFNDQFKILVSKIKSNGEETPLHYLNVNFKPN